MNELKKYINKPNKILAIKKARVFARKGVIGEQVLTYSENANGNSIVEKEATVSSNEDWVISKADINGNLILDKHGHPNTWIVSDKVFNEKYTKIGNNIYEPKAKPQTFVQLEESIKIEQWGSIWNIDKGGYVNITNKDDLYCISKRDFDDTYHII